MTRLSTMAKVLGGTALAFALGAWGIPRSAVAEHGHHDRDGDHGEGHHGHHDDDADVKCVRQVSHVCDPDTGATTCSFHLLNTGNGELVTGTETVTYLTETCTGPEGTTTVQSVEIRGTGVGDTTGRKYELSSTTRTTTTVDERGTTTVTFLYRFELEPQGGKIPGIDVTVRAVTVTDKNGNVTFHACTPANDPLCNGGGGL